MSSTIFSHNIQQNNEMIDENELIQTNTDYKRDSFDDRVCDDLSEVLLSYLSFEDKFGFECISKQWKSLVFNKQRKLCFNTKNIGLIVSKGKSMSEIIEDILRKCKRIDNIDIEVEKYTNIRDRTLILSLITKHCNGLKSIRYDFSGIDMKTIESFGHKFGKSLQVLENLNNERIIGQTVSLGMINNFSTLLKFCHKLGSIKGIPFYDLFDKNNHLLLVTDRLERSDIKIGSNSMKQFENFIDKYKETLKAVSILFNKINSVKMFLIQLLEIISLKELHIELYTYQLIDNLDNSLALISDKFKDLEKLSFTGVCYYSSKFPFKMITHFKKLKYLSISLNLFHKNHLSINSFKDFKNLVHLTVKNIERGDDFFIDIDQYLPQLTVLKVINTKESSVLSDISFDYFSKLANIEKLVIYSLIDFSEVIFVKFINNCKQIKSIELVDKVNEQFFINETIDSLISLAKSKPEISFKFEFKVGEDIISYNQLLNKPNNIVIKFVSSGSTRSQTVRTLYSQPSCSKFS